MLSETRSYKGDVKVENFQAFIYRYLSSKNTLHILLLYKQSLSGSRRLSNLRVSTDTQHWFKHFKSCSSSAQHGMDVESKYKKRALPEANGNWTAKALIIWQWVKVLSYSCKTTKFNWIPKMCSNRTMCGKFRMSFFKLFYFKGRMELGWNQRRTTQVLRQVCLSHSSLFLLQRKHIHIHYCTVHLPMCNNTAV